MVWFVGLNGSPFNSSSYAKKVAGIVVYIFEGIFNTQYTYPV
jgi:hypothetical protein